MNSKNVDVNVKEESSNRFLLDVVCIYDTVTQEYGTPFFTSSKSSCLRALSTQFLQMPLEYIKDFRVVNLGYFDSSNGHIYSQPEYSNSLYIDGEEIISHIKLYFNKEQPK